MKKLAIAIFLVCFPGVVHAAMWVCGDGSRFDGHTFADVSNQPVCPGGQPSMRIPKAETEQQVSMIEGNPKKYLKVVDGRVTLKTQEEKDATDQAIAAEQERVNKLALERTQNTLCNNFDVDVIKARLATFKANLANDTEPQSRVRIANAFEQIALCLATK